MTEVIIAIALTTGTCAYMFFVIPYLDSRKAKSESKKSSQASSGG